MSEALSGWRKVLFATSGRKSRFHSLSGRPMPFWSWVRLPLTLSERLLKLDRKRPWIVPSAIHRLEQLLLPHWTVLELGAGYSTAWLNSRVGHLTSCETDARWYQELTGYLDSDVRLMSVDDIPSFLEAQQPESYDLVFVDCSGDRMRLLRRSADLVKPGGYLLLDNSERYPLACEALEGWSVESYIGVLPRPFCVSETSVFHKPFP